MNCPTCNAEVLDIDVKCGSCGAGLGPTGAHRMIGKMVLDTYELVDVLGQGGMSVVFKARHKMTEQEVALKILPPELAAHSQVKSRFLDEAKALAALDHPNIVHLYNFGQENSSFVLAMQFVQGKTWERMIVENKRLGWIETCRIAIDVLKALEYAHGRGVIHRDMKPSNVLVRAHDASATVMDFGIAKMTTSTRLTATGQTMGTVRYMSPEQVRGQEVDPRTDLYSLGATMYESLVGDTPFDGNTHFEIMTKHLSEPPRPPSAHGVELPREVEDAVMRSLAKRPADRFESSRDMRKLLEAALRAGDLGTTDTQKVSASSLRSRPAPPSAATARSMPDAPHVATQAVRTRRAPRWPMIAASLAVVVLAAAIAAVLALRHRGGYASVTHIHGVTLTAGERVGRLVLETDGRIAPRRALAAYHATLDRLRASDPKLANAKLDVLDAIAVVPGPALCEPSAYPVASPPEDCHVVLATHGIGAHGRHDLLVRDDPKTLDEAMDEGVAAAVCEFQPPGTAEPRLIEICDATKAFAQLAQSRAASAIVGGVHD